MALVIFDTAFLLAITDDRAPIRPAPASSRSTARERIEHLLVTLEKDRATVVVPAPVLAEALAAADADVSATMAILEGLAAKLRIEPFGKAAALECSDLMRRHGLGPAAPGETRTKIKFDHQIVAITKVVGASTIYTDDDGLRRQGTREAIRVQGVWDLPEPPIDPQRPLPFPKPDRADDKRG